MVHNKDNVNLTSLIEEQYLNSMKIYEYKAFPNPRRVRIFLAEKGVEVDYQQINVPEGEHRGEAFRTKNPFAEVPTLELDDGTCISETVAISRYFEEKYPDPPLMGSTPQEQAEIEMWQRRVERSLMEAATTYFHHTTPGLGELEVYQNPEWGKKNREKAAASIEMLDRVLSQRKFIAGDQFSIADITGLCGIDFAAFVGIEIPDTCTNVRRWYKEVSSRPSAQV